MNLEMTDILASCRQATKWPEQLMIKQRRGLDITDELKMYDQKIEALEKQAKEVMKALGCRSPETHIVYQTMADMLMAWLTFKDGLTGR